MGSGMSYEAIEFPEPSDEPDIVLEVPATSVSVVELRNEEGTERQTLAIVFDEQVAEEIAAFLSERYPLPENVVVGVSFKGAHHSEIERWLNR